MESLDAVIHKIEINSKRKMLANVQKHSYLDYDLTVLHNGTMVTSFFLLSLWGNKPQPNSNSLLSSNVCERLKAGIHGSTSG